MLIKLYQFRFSKDLIKVVICKVFFYSIPFMIWIFEDFCKNMFGCTLYTSIGTDKSPGGRFNFQNTQILFLRFPPSNRYHWRGPFNFWEKSVRSDWYGVGEVIKNTRFNTTCCRLFFTDRICSNCQRQYCILQWREQRTKHFNHYGQLYLLSIQTIHFTLADKYLVKKWQI